MRAVRHLGLVLATVILGAGMAAPVASREPPTVGSARIAGRVSSSATQLNPHRALEIAPTRLSTPRPHLPSSIADPTSGQAPAAARRTRRPRTVGGWPGFGETTGFAGLGPPCAGCEPPDPWVAINATQVVQVVNFTVRISTKTGVKVDEFPEAALLAAPASQYEFTDAHIVWDALVGRWLMTAISFDASCAAGHLYISMSGTADPDGSWWSYRWDFAGELPDYPTLGYSGDKVAVGVNLFALDANAPACVSATFDGAELFVGDAAPFQSGASVSLVHTTPSTNLETWQPAKALSAGNTLYATFETWSGSAWDVGYATVTGTVATADVNLTSGDASTGLAIAPWGDPAPPHQPGSPSTISDAIDGRPTDALVQNGHLWFVASYPCTPTGDVALRDCVRVTELGTAGPTLLQDVVIGDIGVDSFMGGIGLSGEGRLYVVYSRSSSVGYVSTYVYSQGPSAPADTFDGPILIAAGGGTYTGTRWGDFVGVATDPSDPYAVWQADEYPTSAHNWTTRVSRLATDVTPPTGTVTIDDGSALTNTTTATLSVPASDSQSGVTSVLVSNAADMSGAVTFGYAPTLPWTLAGGPDGPQSVFVQWRDGAGNLSGIATDSIALDTVVPTASVGIESFVTGSTMSTTAISAQLSYSGADDASGVTGFQLARSVDGGAFVAVSSATSTVTLGHHYQFAVRAVDGAGNLGAWTYGPVFTVGATNETSRSIKYHGTWTRASSSGAIGGKVKYATAKGASATYAFRGNAIAWIAPLAKTDGSAKVYVDGFYRGTISLHSSTFHARRVLFSQAWLSSGAHTIRIVLVGTAHHPRVDLDLLAVIR